MKAEHINPFLDSARRVVASVFGKEPILGRAFLRKEPYRAEEVSVLIGVTGQLRGQFIVTMREETAKLLVSQMMGGMPVFELDELSLSAIGELGNMIAGNTSTVFAEQGLNIDITPPTVLEGARVKFNNASSTLSVPIKITNGDIELALSLADS